MPTVKLKAKGMDTLYARQYVEVDGEEFLCNEEVDVSAEQLKKLEAAKETVSVSTVEKKSNQGDKPA